MTNTAPVGAFRGAGRPEAAAALDRVLDLAALELGLTPEEIRRRNLIPADAFPYRTQHRRDLRQRRLPGSPRRGAPDRRRRRRSARSSSAGSRPASRGCSGIGVSTYVEITGFGGSEFGSVQIHPDGSATVMSGTSAHGQGHATSFSMIVADRLGIPLEQITYVQSDTAVVRTGGGTGGSRSLQLGGNAVARPPTSPARRRSPSRPGCSRPTSRTSCSTTERSAWPASPAPGSRGPSSRRAPTSTTAASGSTPTSPRRAPRSRSARMSRSSRSTSRPAG